MLCFAYADWLILRYFPLPFVDAQFLPPWFPHGLFPVAGVGFVHAAVLLHFPKEIFDFFEFFLNLFFRNFLNLMDFSDFIKFSGTSGFFQIMNYFL